MRNYRSLVCISYPHQLFPALVALIHHRKHLLNEPIDQPTLVYVRLHAKDARADELIEVIQSMASQFEWLTVQITYPHRIGPLSEYFLPLIGRQFLFYRDKAWGEVKDIFYAHDLSADFIPQIMMQCYPRAERICYGDSLGMVYSAAYFTRLIYANGLKAFLKKCRRRWLLPKKPLAATRAILMLPCDPGGDCLTQIPLNIPHESDIHDVLNQLSVHYKIGDALQTWLASSTQKITFLALSNLSDASLTSLDNEVSLYQTIIDTQVETDHRLLIKAHPGTSSAVLSRLKSDLKHTNAIHFMAKDSYPIELCQDLIQCLDQILSISYSSISIPYLYQKPVTHALTQGLIDRYFYPAGHPWVSESNAQYIQIAEELKAWDKETCLI